MGESIERELPVTGEESGLQLLKLTEKWRREEQRPLTPLSPCDAGMPGLSREI